MGSDLTAQTQGTDARQTVITPTPAVVELSLLLPADRLEPLLQLSRARHQSVAQVVRSLIEQALAQA